MIAQIFVLFVLAQVWPSQSAETLKKYNVDPSGVTISGFSSGGAMATQFHFINSAILAGAGVFAGSPYLCGGDFLKCLVLPSTINVTELTVKANALAASGQIDDLGNITNSKVYIYHGQKDISNGPANGRKIAEMYTDFGAQPLTVFNISAQHGMPTNFYGAACGSLATGTQYITNCDYEGSFDMLDFIYGGNLNRPTSYGWDSFPGEFFEFNQDEFFSSSQISGMDSVGYAYVPAGCSNNSSACRLHMVFHGCSMSRQVLGDIFAKKAGYLEVAELNNIILLFPQISASLLANPGGCWDTWGYTDDQYGTLTGSQNQALLAMLNRVVYG